MLPPQFYNQTDQDIYAAGNYFIPQEKFRAVPFNLQNSSNTTDPVSEGIPAIYQSQGGTGGGDYAASLGLGSNTPGFMGNYQDINFDDRYSYTPQGIQIEDISTNPDNIPMSIDNPSAGIENVIAQNQSGYIKPAPEIFEPQQQNIFQKALSGLKTQGSPILGGILSAVTGVPFLGSALDKISGQFQNKPLGAAVIDEFGNVYDEDELNQQNALGGYYSEAARSARRRTSRIANMLARQAAGKKISEKNLAELQAQEAAQQAAQQAATTAMQDKNRDKNTGGYQAGYGADFMEGPGGGKDMGQEASSPGSSGPGGSDSMGSFMNGGIVDLVDIYD
jgi:hypothetical protein